MTGAMLPRGTDCVIPLEEYALADGIASLQSGVRSDLFRNVQRRGADSQPGVPMLRAGTRLGAAGDCGRRLGRPGRPERQPPAAIHGHLHRR